MVYILDELLNVTDDVVKEYYYDEIITTILDTGIADRFIKSLCELIQSLAIDKLHIIGDIYDRGPRADIIMDELMKMHDVDIQWGNHDISWMGAASGNLALIANVIRISMRYNNFDVLEDGYGLNLRALAVFAGETYKTMSAQFSCHRHLMIISMTLLMQSLWQNAQGYHSYTAKARGSAYQAAP